MKTLEPYQQTFFDVPELTMLISLPADFPARTFPSQAKAEASNTASEAACGEKCSASSVNSCRAGCSLRMFLLSELGGGISSSLTWKQQATPSGRSWWVLGRSERRTGETGRGLWPTATAGDHKGSGGRNQVTTGRTHAGTSLTDAARNWFTPKASDGRDKGTTSGDSVTVQVMKAWPTPNKCDADRGPESRETKKARGSGGMNLHGAVWGTPAAQDAKNDTLPPSQEKRDTLPGSIMRFLPGPENRSTNGKRPVLNGRWVLQLMGYPSNWCDLPTSTLSALRETRSCRKSSK